MPRNNDQPCSNDLEIPFPGKRNWDVFRKWLIPHLRQKGTWWTWNTLSYQIARKLPKKAIKGSSQKDSGINFEEAPTDQKWNNLNTVKDNNFNLSKHQICFNLYFCFQGRVIHSKTTPPSPKFTHTKKRKNTKINCLKILESYWRNED